MKTRLLKSSLVAAVVMGGLLVWCPAVTRGASDGKAAGGKHGAAKERVKSIAEELKLSDEQKQQLKSILKEEGQKLKSLRAERGLSRQQKRVQLKQIREDLQAKIKAILTPEQLEKWQKLRGEMHGRHPLKRQFKGAGL